MRILIAIGMCLTLNGCWFVFIPGSVIQSIGDGLSGQFGDACIPASLKVGDTINFPDGTPGTVKRISGPSSRCTNPNKPVRAEVIVRA